MSRLRIITTEGSPKRRVIELADKPVMIGRHPDSDLLLTDLGVARHHIMISPEGQTHRLESLVGGSPVQVNGTRILAAHVLQPQDRITIGALAFSLSSASAA